MSEYQFYDFLSMDRPLTEREMKQLRDLSTRAEITRFGFTNHYNFGDFRGNPRKMMERYFDLFLYDSNWGVRQFMVRFPEGMIAPETLEACRLGEAFGCWSHKGDVILRYRLQDEELGWPERGSKSWMPLLSPIRREVMEGDLRPLFLGWLLFVQSGEGEDDAPTPFPPPPGLATLTNAQDNLADFLCLDVDLIEAAAQFSPPEPDTFCDPLEFSDWLVSRPQEEKDHVLRRLAETDAPHVRTEWLARFRRESRPPRKLSPPAAAPGYPATIKEWVDRWDHVREVRTAREEQEKAAEKERRKRAATKAREARLRALAKNSDNAWERVEALIGEKTKPSYDEAVILLSDLLELASRAGSTGTVIERIRELRKRHAQKPNLIERLNKAGLPPKIGR